MARSLTANGVGKTLSKARKPSSRSSKAAAPSIRNYRAATNWLKSLTNVEQMIHVDYSPANFNLSRMRKLLAKLDNPQRDFKSVHIAGTKGKGSTAAMLSRMLTGSGYDVGLYTSPHLLTVRERLVINGEMISEQDFARTARKVAAAAASLGGGVTYFEVLTAMAFTYFSGQGVDIAVLETGLGGRLDSTNVVSPEACGVTSIAYDHMQQLGTSLTEIAAEKAGIFKTNVPVISAPQNAEVEQVLRKMAEEAKSPLRFTGTDIEFSYRFEASRGLGPHTRLSLTTPQSRFEHLHVPLLGEHQAINCSVALSLLDVLKDRGIEIDDQRAMSGLAGISLPGRMEMIRDTPRVLIDGAHNASSIEALMRAIGQNITYDSMVVIFGCNRDKDVAGMLKHVRLGSDKTIFTTTGSPRTMDPQDLAAIFTEHTGRTGQVTYSLEDAMQIAECAVSKEDLICITGSFYLAGQAKRKLQKLEPVAAVV